MFITLDRDYEVKCTLGTIKDIESMFKKPFMTLISELNKLTTSEQIKLIFAGVRRSDKSVVESDFVAKCDDYLGLGGLTDYLEQFVYEIQYPGKTREEAQEIISKKLQATERLKASIGSK